MHKQNTAKLHYGINQSNTILDFSQIVTLPNRSKVRVVSLAVITKQFRIINDKINVTETQKQQTDVSVIQIIEPTCQLNKIGCERELLTIPPHVLSHLLPIHSEVNINHLTDSVLVVAILS